MATIKAGVKIDASSAERSNKILHDLNESLKNMQKNFEELSDIVGAGTKDLDSFAKKTASTSKIGKVFHSIFDKIKSMFGSLGAVVASVEKAFGKFGIEVGLTTFGLERLAKEGAKVEQLHARLLTMVGSNRFANAMTGWIREMTTKLPIAREDLYDMVSQLSVFGVTPTFKQTATVLGTAALAGKTFAQAFQEIFAVMDPTNTKKINDLVQSFNWRIPQSALMNMQIMLARTDPMNYAKRWQIVTDALSGFASGGIYLANTAQGMLQRIHASLEIFFENIGTAFLPQLKSVYGAILNFFDKNKKTLVKVASEIGSTIGNLISIMKFLVKPLVDIFVTIKNIIFGQGDIFKNVVAPILVISAGLAVQARKILTDIDQFLIDLTTGHFLKALKDLPIIIGDVFNLLWDTVNVILGKIRNRLSEILKQMGIGWAIGPAQSGIIVLLAKIGIKAFEVLKNIMLWPVEVFKTLTSASKLNETMGAVATNVEKATVAMQSMAVASSTAAVASSSGILAGTMGSVKSPTGEPEWGPNYTRKTAGGIFVTPAIEQELNEETEKTSTNTANRFVGNFTEKVKRAAPKVKEKLTNWGVGIAGTVGFVAGSMLADEFISNFTNSPILLTAGDLIAGSITKSLAGSLAEKLIPILGKGLLAFAGSPVLVAAAAAIAILLAGVIVDKFRDKLNSMISVGVGGKGFGIIEYFKRLGASMFRAIVDGLSLAGSSAMMIVKFISALFTGDWSGAVKASSHLLGVFKDLMTDLAEILYRTVTYPIFSALGEIPKIGYFFKSSNAQMAADFFSHDLMKTYQTEKIPVEKLTNVTVAETLQDLAKRSGAGSVYEMFAGKFHGYEDLNDNDKKKVLSIVVGDLFPQLPITKELLDYLFNAVKVGIHSTKGSLLPPEGTSANVAIPVPTKTPEEKLNEDITKTTSDVQKMFSKTVGKGKKKKESAKEVSGISPGGGSSSGSDFYESAYLSNVYGTGSGSDENYSPSGFTPIDFNYKLNKEKINYTENAIKKYSSLIINEAKKYEKYGITPELLASLISVESSGIPDSVSRFGAMGLMQLRPDTARYLGVKNPFNPEENIRGGTKYLAQLLERYHGNYRLALAAYNMGPSAMEKYRKEHEGKLPKKVEEYVNNVLYSEFGKPAKFDIKGFNEPKIDIHNINLSVIVKNPSDVSKALKTIAKGLANVADTSYSVDLGYGTITPNAFGEAVKRAFRMEETRPVPFYSY